MADQVPSVGDVLDGYRFKGGDPKQESSWEQVAPIDVSGQYGPGARQLPNGVIERVGPKGGVTRIGSVNGSAGGSEASALVGADARARFMINLGPLRAAQGNLEEMDREGYDPSSLRNIGAAALEAVPFDGGFAARAVGGGEYNAYNQAAKTFEAAIMPIMSGAAVTPSEAQRLIRAALPQPGDTPEVLAQKSEQRRMMINAVAEGIGQPAPYEITAAADALDAGSEADPAVSATQPGTPPAAPEGPGSGPDSPVDISGLSASDLMALQPGQYIKFPDGRVEQLSGAPRVGAQGEEVSPGVFADQQARVDDVAGVMFSPDQVFARSALEQVPLAREAMAGITSAFTGNSYQDTRRAQQLLADTDREQQPLARNMGGVAGATALAATPFGAPLRVTRGASLAGRVVNRAAGGSVAGGAWGFGQGEGNAIERLPDAGRGALFGAGAAVGAPIVASNATRIISPAINALADGARVLARPIVNALGDSAPEALQAAVAPNALARGLERFAGTNRPNINALNATREQLEGAVGRPVAAASVVNTGGRAMLRGVATRSDGAREIAENFGQGTAEALPARVGQQGRRILSNDTRSPDAIRAALDAERSNMARTTYAEPYAQPVQIGEDIAGALSGAPGRAAIQRARSAAEAWQDTAVMAELDALDAATRAGQPLPQVSAGAVDRIRQAMSGRGEKLAQNPATRAVGAGVQNRAGQVDGALDNVEGLAPARAAYRDTSRQIDAVDAGERFMGSAPDTVAADMRGAPASAQAPFRAAAARSIERGAGSTQTAPGVANRLAIPGTPQRQMMDETLGVDDARRLSDAMRGERDIYRGAQQVDPGVGSQTTNNAMKAMDAAGAVSDLAAGRPLGAVRRVIGMLDSRGFNPQQAEAVLEAMTDPRRTDEVIVMLSDRMSRREARNLTRALRYQLTTGPQSGQQR